MVDLEGTLRSSLGGRYDIEEEIGRGGMSVVFRAHDPKHNRTVAIKVLRPELSEQIGAERFQREIEVVAGITHPHILALHDSGEAGGLLYYVMPFVEDGSLRARMENEGALPEADAVRIAGEIADALGYAHRHGVIHRDVKPGNILLAGNHALLADFGIAHLASADQTTLTLAGLALGTPAYLSPEQASGEKEIDGRSDIYSLGCVLYEALSGSPPFSDDSVRAMLLHQLVDTPVPVRSLNEGVSQIAETIVETAIRKEPSERFQTGEQMARALELASGSPHRGIPTRFLRRLGVPRRHVGRARMAIAAATAMLAVLVLFSVWIRERGTVDFPLRSEVRYIVLENERADATEWERTLSRRATRRLREQLDGWTTVSVVQEPAMEGSMAELRVAGLSQSVFSVASGLAERFRADFIVYVDATELGGLTGAAVDSAQSRVLIQASLLDPATGDDLGFSRIGPVDSLRVVTAGIALEMLKLEGEPADYPTLLGRSQDHLAQQEFQAGRDALWAWRLAEAHRLLEAAVARDSAFALARHLLAQTMYWEMSRDEERLRELGPQIDYHSRTADRVGTSTRLRPGERNAVNAFRAFWTGDYDLARARYDSLIEDDPFDLESLVLRGAVEIEDPILRERDDGTLLPRQNLNVARAVFDTATILNSEWELSWGHLHSIDMQVANTAYLGICYGFEKPGDDLVPPYMIREAVEQHFFCPVVRADTIEWTRSVRGALPGDSASIAAAAAIHARTVELLDRSARVELDQPRHHEQLATFLLWEQHLPRCEADPVRTDSLGRLARRHVEQALNVRRDTTPQDLITLALFELGGGDVAAAVAAVETALTELEGWQTQEGTPPPLAAANPFLAAGRAHPAVDILERVWGENTMAVMDPQDSTRTIDTYGTYATMNALLALGSLGESGPAVAERFDRLHRTWREAPLSDKDRSVLRFVFLSYVGPALVHSPGEWEEWSRGWEQYRLELPPVWKGVVAAAESPPNLEEARDRLDEAIQGLGADPAGGPVIPNDLYLPIVLAERIGATDVADGLRGRLSRCALRLDTFDAGWAMRSSLGMND